MVFYTTNPALLYKFFPITLTGLALTWYTSLPNGSINSFGEFEPKFLSHFMASKRQEKSNFHLLSITQQERESFSAYLQRLDNGVLAVTDLETSIVVSALINGMKTHKLKFQLLENQVKTYSKAMRQANSFVIASDICHQLDPNSKKRKSDKMAETQRQKPQNQNQVARRGPNQSEGERKYPPRKPRNDGYEARFNRNRRDIFYAMRDELPPPSTIPTPKNGRNMDLWCEYHKKHGLTLSNYHE